MKVTVKITTAKVLYARKLSENDKEPMFGICRVEMVADGRMNKKLIVDKLNELELSSNMGITFLEVLSAYSRRESKEVNELTNELMLLEILIDEASTKSDVKEGEK